jgi:hypothetical protein
VRGWLKGSIAVLMAALVCVAIAPVVAAAEPPQEEEGVFLELSPRKQTRVIVSVNVTLGVAVIDTEMGSLDGPRPHRPRGEVEYAVRIPKAPLAGHLDLKVPGLLSIDGELAPSGSEEGVEFNGSLRFTGRGGYLSFDATHATGGNGSLACEAGCLGPHPSLFAYIENDVPFVDSNHNTQVLHSELKSHGRVGVFQAAHWLDDPRSNFAARGLEWLAGNVAAIRTIEVAGAAGSEFKSSSKAEHPRWATVRPPGPFSGRATYRKVATIRSPASGKLTGSLAVDIFGVKVRLAGARAKALLGNFNPGF